MSTDTKVSEWTGTVNTKVHHWETPSLPRRRRKDGGEVKEGKEGTKGNEGRGRQREESTMMKVRNMLQFPSYTCYFCYLFLVSCHHWPSNIFHLSFRWVFFFPFFLHVANLICLILKYTNCFSQGHQLCEYCCSGQFICFFMCSPAHLICFIPKYSDYISQDYQLSEYCTFNPACPICSTSKYTCWISQDC